MLATHTWVHRCSRGFQETSINFHYEFNVRHLSKVIVQFNQNYTEIVLKDINFVDLEDVIDVNDEEFENDLSEDEQQHH